MGKKGTPEHATCPCPHVQAMTLKIWCSWLGWSSEEAHVEGDVTGRSSWEIL